MKLKKIEKKKQNILLILDGFGLADFKKIGNAVTPKTAPNVFGYMKTYASSTLKASGRDVGLFASQAGNSEAGHFNIGGGRIVKQDLLIISEAIENGTFFKNEAFDQALFHAQKYDRPVHVIGLLTDGHSAHSHPDHLYALLEYFRRKQQKKVYLHLFTDGRDSSPHAVATFLKDLRKRMKNGEEIASIIGRFYAMDRNKIWERTERTYDALVYGKGFTAESAEEAIAQAYNRGETDEYIQPTIVTKNKKPIATIESNDVVFFFNARSDRTRQLTKMFVQKDFCTKNKCDFNLSKGPHNTRFVAMTDFGPDLPGIFTAFPSPDISNALPKAIGENCSQLYISETEKYAHVTYFINGGYADPVNGEKRELVASTGNYSYADRPEMSSAELTKRILSHVRSHDYDLIVVNFPNADMVGHTGNFEAAKKAVKCVDSHVKEIVDFVLKIEGTVMIIADHGNAEEMINADTGEMMTGHTRNSVPCIIVSKDMKGRKMKCGRLADVAPTLLKLMGIKKPKEMTGKALI
jgi:2,3-bisphosphoglycerate-independent phosphoglycerate mutase